MACFIKNFMQRAIYAAYYAAYYVSRTQPLLWLHGYSNPVESFFRSLKVLTLLHFLVTFSDTNVLFEFPIIMVYIICNYWTSNFLYKVLNTNQFPLTLCLRVLSERFVFSNFIYFLQLISFLGTSWTSKIFCAFKLRQIRD